MSKTDTATLARRLQRAVAKTPLPPFDAEAFLAGPVAAPLRGRTEQHEIPNPVTTQSEIENPKTAMETVSTDIHSIPKKEKCAASSFVTGKPCRAYPLKTSELCLFHEKNTDTGWRDAQERGRESQKRTRERDVVIDLEDLRLLMVSRDGLAATTEMLLRMELAGSLSAARSGRILRYIRSLQHHVDEYEKHNSLDDTYDRLLERAFAIAPTIVGRSADEEAAERARKIEDIGAARREFLRANEEHARQHPKPERNPSPSHPDFRPARTPNAFAPNWGLKPLAPLSSLFGS